MNRLINQYIQHNSLKQYFDQNKNSVIIILLSFSTQKKNYSSKNLLNVFVYTMKVRWIQNIGYLFSMEEKKSYMIGTT